MDLNQRILCSNFNDYEQLGSESVKKLSNMTTNIASSVFALQLESFVHQTNPRDTLTCGRIPILLNRDPLPTLQGPALEFKLPRENRACAAFTLLPPCA